MADKTMPPWTAGHATVREALEARERESLSPHAMRSADSRGREREEPEDDFRTVYQRDRDRILHTKAFRRLKRKTQVFLAPRGDHYRTRLTHTLEVMQIARTISRALNLNEDLTEAIALGHDLGHTPFGHAGEAVLNELYEHGFRHFEQSLRVVDKLEKRGENFGLNLTWEVRDGILYHSKAKAILFNKESEGPHTLEGMVMSISDAIAYINHDIDDALRAGVITLEDLPQDALEVLGRKTSDRIDAMVVGLLEGSTDSKIDIAPTVKDAINSLRNYLYTQVYPAEKIDNEIRKAKHCLRQVYQFLLENPLPEISEHPADDPIERRIVDFVAGMTDEYAMSIYQRHILPSPWIS
jgi:dGTPase